MTPEDVTRMKQAIIRTLEGAEGQHLARAILWAKLPNFEEEEWATYWTAEQSLVDEQRIERRRGRNGGIYLLPPAQSAPRASLDPEFVAESTFYPGLLQTMLANWTQQPGYTHVFGAITATSGRRQTGGRWSRPDLVICTVSDWLFSSRPEGDVRTIEVKRYEALDVLGVYEALSHKARAHYAYLLIVDFPAELTSAQESDFEVILSAASKHGIGVITVAKADDWETWAFELDPHRSDADHQAINDLLYDQVPAAVRDQFRAAIRSITVTI